LVVTRDGIPLGYEIFDGNTRDVTTLQKIVEIMEARYGQANRIWVVDRGMVSKANLKFLAQPPRRYIVGTPKSMLKKFQHHLLSQNWQSIREGVEVQYCTSPEFGEEIFILCRSADRQNKEHAIAERFRQRVEKGLQQLQKNCEQGRLKEVRIAERRIGRLL
jgi:transposase